ncbi:uncharacterized protein LOC133193533 [Saccostrea echinata]|uniref:uncharacterized protein LOC133193533 n=1 Tax=Saccostrea echinata TaxID=191078 RepID=UPI002A7F94CB|nr:uncharacterized protein LOC133193533 [Saccostrea echinata]
MISQLGKGALLGKMDIKSAFRLLPIKPNDFCLLGFKFEGKYYIDKCLPFGCSISCATFEKFASFLEWAVRSQFGFAHVTHYLDDFLFAGSANSDDCLRLMRQFGDLCKALGIPLAIDKTVGPVTKLTYLGLKIDTCLGQVRIPNDKLIKLKISLTEMTNKSKVTLKEMQSLWTKFRELAPKADVKPTPIPPVFHSLISGAKPLD